MNRTFPSLLAMASLASGCAVQLPNMDFSMRGPQVTHASNTMVVVEGTPVTGSGNTQVYAMAEAECRKQGRKHAAIYKSETLRLHPRWYFHCVN
ncbi:MAG: hypothetical protein HY854_10280 [Burkholderiales bacterium]|nr:hypothetical protein [Burkholderiales bacterium]